jgi:glycosyltransferase involved in cell wall biosynthesis
MFQITAVDVEIYCPSYLSQHLKDVPSQVFSGREDFSAQHLWRYKRLIHTTKNLDLFRKRIAQQHFDVAHHTYYWPLPNKLPVKARVATIHDLIDEEIAPNRVKSLLKLRSIRQVDHVICVSEYTRNTLLKHFDIAPEKITVVHLGKPEFIEEIFPMNIDGRPYILYVGPRTGYKNFLRIMHAYAESNRLRKDFRMICFGGGAFTAAEMNTFQKCGLSADDVLHLTGDDTDLHSAYRGASLFVYPSLYEGFGLPPLEAMTLGVPLACSNSTSIPEIVGVAGEYFDPTDIDSMISAMENVLYSDKRKMELINEGKKRSNSFSWSKCTQETLDIYRTII